MSLNEEQLDDEYLSDDKYILDDDEQFDEIKEIIIRLFGVFHGNEIIKLFYQKTKHSTRIFIFT